MDALEYYLKNGADDHDHEVYKACLSERAFTCLTNTQRSSLRDRMREMLGNLRAMDAAAFYEEAETAIHTAPHPNGEDDAIHSLLLLDKAITSINHAEENLGAAIKHLDSLSTYEQAHQEALSAARQDFEDAEFIKNHGLRAFYGIPD